MKTSAKYSVQRLGLGQVPAAKNDQKNHLTYDVTHKINETPKFFFLEDLPNLLKAGTAV